MITLTEDERQDLQFIDTVLQNYEERAGMGSMPLFVNSELGDRATKSRETVQRLLRQDGKM